MKELSIEEKAKRYDEALEKARQLCAYPTTKPFISDLQDLFPELKESEDEKIRKALIKCFSGFEKDSSTWGGFKRKDILAWLEKQKILTTEEDLQGKEDVLWCIKQAKKHAKDENEMGTCWFAEKWLEKQGEQKSLDDIAKEVTKDKATAISFLKSTGIINENGELADEYKIEQSEQKPADKVEPKFKVEEGKWYVCISQFCNCVEGRVYKAISDSRIVDDFGTEYDMHSDAYKYFRLWTIQDAKEGDVLIDKSGSRECPFIFKETKPSDIKTDMLNPLTVLGYCGIGGAGFTKGSGWGDTANCIYYPATKKQSGLLFQKMKEAGYEWDAEKKEMKKIEQNHAWSKEDEKIIIQIKKALEDFFSASETDKIKYWLESLKYRIQPQSKQEWKQENTGDLTDFENAMMHIGGSFFGENAGLDPNDTNEIKAQANFLLELVPKSAEWSEEDETMITDLSVIVHTYFSEISDIPFKYDLSEDKIKTWLKSLRPQNTWKPSDEQMEALWSATEKYLESDYEQVRKLRGKVLKSLYEDLKKLREK